jgi:hypothetical protein
MKQCILTICDQKTKARFDVELPTDLEIEKLLDDLTQALEGYQPSLSWNLSQTALWSPRLERQLAPQATLEDEGVWNGDYLYIVTKKP